jgi:hypothetical protein
LNIEDPFHYLTCNHPPIQLICILLAAESCNSNVLADSFSMTFLLYYQAYADIGILFSNNVSVLLLCSEFNFLCLCPFDGQLYLLDAPMPLCKIMVGAFTFNGANYYFLSVKKAKTRTDSIY